MKRLVVLCLLLSAALFASPALAGPYLNTAAMLLRESSLAGDWMQQNLGDRELARAAHALAQARSDVASHMVVPQEVRKAHPHLLLALGKVEQAMEAASQNRISQFVQLMQASQGEARTFRSVLAELNLKLPESHSGRCAWQPASQPTRLAALVQRTFWDEVLGKERSGLRSSRPGLFWMESWPVELTSKSSVPAGL